MPTLRLLRKLVIAVLGFTVVLVGVAMIVLPGPAFIVIPAGLAILATEFVWARRLLVHARARLARVRRRKQPRQLAVSRDPGQLPS